MSELDAVIWHFSAVSPSVAKPSGVILQLGWHVHYLFLCPVLLPAALVMIRNLILFINATFLSELCFVEVKFLWKGAIGPLEFDCKFMDTMVCSVTRL